ncbi:unfertilized embryo sac 10, PHYTOCHROME INTERACTING FACTOR 8 [Hibiscus trionum]|uniref:Unfertilized embryo sac 10, PHYTOCHROME INTERACTING FACTOR 8 n=1 Tax=Hibiscus trionum TaxID=183268 RepID=A0A9W7GZW8_HIBTR|nr:unfertilized embryo sac 10, PHYTOCHROME INTERACTING FACTOR 8 [Hibiscus trionum]
MSQCVPSWDLDDNHAAARHSLRSDSNSTAPDAHTSDYEVAELTWENGQLAMHGLGLARVPAKPFISKYNTWDKPRGNGTLESIVNQATRVPYLKVPLPGGGDEIAPCLDQRKAAADALVPCSKRTPGDHRTTHVVESNSIPGLGGSLLVGSSTRVGSCSVPAGAQDDDALVTEKRTRAAAAARVPVTSDWSGKEQSASASATFGRDSQYVTFDTYEKDLGVGFTSTSLGSPENTSSTKPCTRATATTTTADDHDSVCHSRPQREGMEEEKKETGKSSVSNKRSRAAAIHNQSERKRRDKINQRMKTLQKLVPNSSKTDKASMLDEVIDYMKQLQAQVHMINRMNIPPMMWPMAMQQQLQMSMMAPAMGMGMGVMDTNTMGRPNIAGISPFMPNPFMNMTSWDGSGGRLQQAASAAAAMPDPLSAFMACQSQPMTMDAYSRLAAMYQQMQQQAASASKS